MGIEGARCVAVESSHEHDRSNLPPARFHHLEAGHIGKLYINEQHVRSMLRDGRQSVCPVGTLTYDLDRIIFFEQAADSVASGRLIVGYQRTERGMGNCCGVYGV